MVQTVFTTKNKDSNYIKLWTEIDICAETAGLEGPEITATRKWAIGGFSTFTETGLRHDH